ncbi:hypothetical protein BDZ91DRAFT_797548 [Kalaharituber pfeilii]|nr:hypothetical protein BDZ91DRAFT_797548 [Kalaharituber pfeilii]
MDTLPLELLELIVSHLPAPLSPYASICKAFVPLIETRTFQTIENVYPNDLPILKFLLSGPHRSHRRNALAMLVYHVRLPNSDAIVTTDEQAFTFAVRKLLEVLRGWEEDDPGSLHRHGLELVVLLEFLANVNTTPQNGHGAHAGYASISSSRDEASSLLNLSQAFPVDIPAVNLVSSFDLLTISPLDAENDDRHVPPALIARLTGRLSQVKKIFWDLWGARTLHADVELLKSVVSDFIECLATLPPGIPILTCLSLNYPFFSEHGIALFSPLQQSSPETIDNFSRALHNITIQCPNLTTLTLNGITTSHYLFWPDSPHGETALTPHWPKLESLIVCSNMLTQENNEGIEKIIGLKRMMLAVSRAANNMPRLRSLDVTLNPYGPEAVQVKAATEDELSHELGARTHDAKRRCVVKMGRIESAGGAISSQVWALWKKWVGEDGAVEITYYW